MPPFDLLTLLPYFFMFFLSDFKFLYLCLLWPCRFYLLLLTFFLSAEGCADARTHTTLCAFDLFFVQITFSNTDRCGWIIFSEYFTYRILTPSPETFTNTSWFAVNEFRWLLVTSWWSPSSCCQLCSTKSSKPVPGLRQRLFPPNGPCLCNPSRRRSVLATCMLSAVRYTALGDAPCKGRCVIAASR